ncbi:MULTISPECIES: hypothetical protein [unclassified Sutcliffiella]|uniref:hypothetical protein n=1 Tax=unclassified Sutcliffiella TaxID=2837532 RepID=UPI0030D12B90
MSSLGSIFSLFVFIAVLVVILLFFRRGLRIVKSSTSIKKNFWILGGYVLVLLFATVIFFFQEDRFLEVNEQSIDENGYILFDRLMNKEKIEEHYLTSRQKHSLYEKDLFLNGDTSLFDYSIILEKTDALQGEMEVILYKGLFEINEFDFSDELPAPLTSYSNGTLELEPAPFFEKHIAYMTLEFPLVQFIENRWSMQGSSSSSRDYIIHIKVPQDVNVSWNEDLMYVTEIK